MIYDNLTEEQEEFAEHPSEAFVEACPGAGKTRTLVERLHKLAAGLPSRRGIALLSYTNSAVDEFSQRCRDAGLESALRFPSFIGTFDGFLRHFIVMPAGTAASPNRPTVVDSWDTLGVEIRLQGNGAFRGPALSLDAFDADLDAIVLKRIRHAALRAHVEGHLADYETACRRRRHFLFGTGYLSAADVRSHARVQIQAPAWNNALGRAIASRFYELIVDEAQDCNPHDLEILTWLRGHGLRVTLVSDLDQSIYGFRHGLPSNLREFSETYPAESRLSLTGNFRSSPAICSLASTLRTREQMDEPLGESKDVAHPVVIITYRGAVSSSVGLQFGEQLDRFELPRSAAIVLSHKKRTARSALGISTEDGHGQSKAETLAYAAGVFWSPASGARARESALQIIETLILDCMGVRNDREHISQVTRRLGLDRRQLRRQALEVATGVSGICADTDDARETWLAVARGRFEQLGLALPAGVTIRGFLRRPVNGGWSKHLEGDGQMEAMKYSTVHEAKGREHRAVCVVMPPNRAPENHTETLVGTWEARTVGEGKRVLYVGATRAQELLVIAIPIAFADRVVAVLGAAETPFERVDLA